MHESEKNNIIYEILILNQSISEVWAILKNSPYLFPLFVDLKVPASAGSSGKFLLKRWFFPLKGTFKIESYDDQRHFFVDIFLEDSPSLLLLTVEAGEGGTILHLDHRSFIGKVSRSHSRVFSRHWKRLINQFHQMNRQEIKRQQRLLKQQ